MSARMPAAEVDIDEDLVRRLLAAQFPEWAELPVTPVPAIGWDNVIYRLGPDLAVRLPRRQLAADLTATEHRWLPDLAGRLPVPVPVPLGRGRPGEGYPWRWTVCPWIAGEIAATVTIPDPDTLALALGAFVAALHTPAPRDGPRNAWRGIPLAGRDPHTRGYLDQLDGVVNVDAARAAWEEACRVPLWDGPDVWLHGDLHPANILVDAEGRLSGVIDFGDLCVGDPACDLMSAWMLLPPTSRSLLRDATGVDDATWARGRGWALTLSLAILANSADNPTLAAVGHRGLAAVLADAGVGSDPRGVDGDP